MMEAVIRLKGACNWVTGLLSEFDVNLRVLDCSIDGKIARDLAEIDLNREEIGAVVEHLRTMPSVEAVDVDQVEKGRAWVVVTARECGLCTLLQNNNCFLVQAVGSPGGDIDWKLVFTEKRHLQDLVLDLKENGIEVKVLRISKFSEKESLTDRQEQMIRQALALGYYDFPKRIGIRELAEKFDVSTATLSETLRRGQKKILEEYFER